MGISGCALNAASTRQPIVLFTRAKRIDMQSMVSGMYEKKRQIIVA